MLNSVTSPGYPETCPVCHGQGLMNKPPWVAGDQYTWNDNSTAPYTCKVCNGSGIIWIVDNH